MMDSSLTCGNCKATLKIAIDRVVNEWEHTRVRNNIVPLFLTSISLSFSEHDLGARYGSYELPKRIGVIQYIGKQRFPNSCMLCYEYTRCCCLV